MHYDYMYYKAWSSAEMLPWRDGKCLLQFIFPKISIKAGNTVEKRIMWLT